MKSSQTDNHWNICKIIMVLGWLAAEVLFPFLYASLKTQLRNQNMIEFLVSRACDLRLLLWSSGYILAKKSGDEMTGAMVKIVLVPRVCLQTFALQLITPCYTVWKEARVRTWCCLFVFFSLCVCEHLFICLFCTFVPFKGESFL